MTVFNPNRTFGVELEVVTRRRKATLVNAINAEFERRGMSQAHCQAQQYNHSVSSYWKIVSDSTISPSGWEVVSPILKGFDGKDQIDAVCKALSDLDCTVNTSVGMHVHHDARGLSAKQIGAVIGTYAAFQDILNYGVSRSRRGREYGGYNHTVDWGRITDNGNKNFDRIPTYGVTTSNRGTISGDQPFVSPSSSRNLITALLYHMPHARNSSISIGSSLNRHGTIEFRQHQGTVNATKVWAWVLITQSVVETQVQNRVRFPKPLNIEMANGKMHAKGDFYRFKSFIAVTADRNNHDTEASAPYMWAFKQLYKNIKKFANEDGISDPKTIGR